ncbi:MAG: hypothetical protein U0599_12620 [Vicinamibacteria bacterium]
MVGRAKLDVLDVTLRPGAVPVLVGRAANDTRPLDLPCRAATAGGAGPPPRSSR